MRTALLAFLLLVHATFAGSARATTVDDICSPPGSPQGSKPCACTASTCEVKSMAPVTNGSVLDFAGRDLILKQRGTIDVGGGSLAIKAANVTMEGGSAVLGAPNSGTGGSITVEATTGNIVVLKDALIDVGGAPAGSVDLDAIGDVRIAGALRANGTDEGDGGAVRIDANSIDIPGTLEFFGRGEGFAGDATLLAVAGFSLAGLVDGSGENGGTLDIDASTGEVSTTAQIRLQATKAGGDGGSVAIVAAGRVILGGQFRLGGDGSGEGGGSGGAVDVDAEGPIEIRATLIDVSGAPPTGFGGDINVFSAGDITLATLASTLEIQAQAKGSSGLGGFVEFDSEGSIQLPSISAFGGAAGSGGTVFASAWCTLALAPGRTIDTRGVDGATTLSAGGQITVGGRLFAGSENRIEYLDPATPDLAGGTFDPAVNQVPVPTLIPCGGPIIPGCGDGVPNAPEECDDGNTDSCDGCSRSCKIERCGNGDIECAEQCDDGNTDDCDRCKGDCSRPDDVCGDGIPECGEELDDGNLVACDGVSQECRRERCGNETTECAEECDEGESGSPSCSAQCQAVVPPRCGDGIVQLEDGETCDDQNAVDCDGCSHFCQFDGCGSGRVEASCNEQCDDFNTRPGDGCSGTCQIESCGNGRVDAGEQCDDGNGNDCDGCRSDCTVPINPCPTCTAGGPAQCVPCTGAIDCDPSRACGFSACSAGVCTPVNPPSCDDGNACTVDSCDPASGCTSTPVVCQDATACDGTLACNPATGQCANGPAPDCDDGDECTNDACAETSPGGTCRNDLRPGIEGARCHLTALQRVIDAITTPKSTRKKLRAQAKNVTKKLTAAAGSGKKAVRARKQINNGLKALTRTVAKAQRKLDPATVIELNTAITRATVAVGGL